MKMGEKGLSTVAIVAIVVTVVVVAVVAIAAAVILIKGGGAPSGLSLYPGSQSWAIPSSIQENVPAGVNLAGYTVGNAGPQDVLNWYENYMATAGWTLTGNLGNMLVYRNGNDGAVVVVISTPEQTCYILATAPWSTIIEMGLATTTTSGTTTTHPFTTTTTTTPSVGSATSLQFDVNSTAGGISATYTFMAKNIGTPSLMIRIDGTIAGQNMIIILNEAQQKAWVYTAGTWTDLSSNYSTYWSQWSQTLQSYQLGLSGWVSGTYTSPDGTVTISNIQVNPTLPDSLFQPTSATATTTHTPTSTTTAPAGITSLSCAIDITSENMSGTLTIKAKNIGTDGLKLRYEGTIQTMGMTENVVYIINGELQEAWMCVNGQWSYVSNFSTFWNELTVPFNEGVSQLSGWTGGEINYTDPATGYSYRMYDIVLNPSLSDSLFIGQGVTTSLTTTTTTPGGYVGTGTENYSGDLSGSGYIGTWGVTVDWSTYTVDGWFIANGMGPYNISGTVSPGAINAEGTAAGNLVSWSGTFSLDGSSVSGVWSFGAYSGTWSGGRSTATPTTTTTTAPVAYSGGPIFINSDDQFTAANGVISGSGTQADPYIIQGWSIDASSANGIDIQNTTAYFIVRNCLVENGGNTYDGIYLYNVINGEIENDTCNNNSYGIYLNSLFSNSLTGNNLINNTCGNNSEGIYLSFSSYGNLANNTCRNNTGIGIDLESSDNNALTSNTCSNNSGDGVYLVTSDNNALINNTCENNTPHGIGLFLSDNNTLTSNVCEYNSEGILLSSSDNNNLTNNTCEYNSSGDGIDLNTSDNNTLTSNTCGNNSGDGIYLIGSSNNSLTSNTCEYNSDDGICLAWPYSNYNTLTGNTASNNAHDGIYVGDVNNTISNNTCLSNSAVGGYFDIDIEAQPNTIGYNTYGTIYNTSG